MADRCGPQASIDVDSSGSPQSWSDVKVGDKFKIEYECEARRSEQCTKNRAKRARKRANR